MAPKIESMRCWTRKKNVIGCSGSILGKYQWLGQSVSGYPVGIINTRNREESHHSPSQKRKIDSTMLQRRLSKREALDPTVQIVPPHSQRQPPWFSIPWLPCLEQIWMLRQRLEQKGGKNDKKMNFRGRYLRAKNFLSTSPEPLGL